MKAKARVPDPRGEQPERLAANEAGCGRNSLRCASMRRKIALNRPGIRGMSVKKGAPGNIGKTGNIVRFAGRAKKVHGAIRPLGVSGFQRECWWERRVIILNHFKVLG